MDINKKLIKQAQRIVVSNNNYSVSFLQRTLQIGYNRAAILTKIIKQKEKPRGIRLYSKKKKKFRYVRR